MIRRIAWALAGALLLTGCSFHGLYGVPLPGGAADDGHAYHVTVEFDDVLDLVPQSAVKVDDVTVGAVEQVQLDGWHARVRLRIADSVKLPANAVAELRQTSILGEKYVALAAPTGTAPAGRLTDGAVIPLARTSRSAEIEEVLAALSALLNGGGVAQLHTITVELGRALGGREDQVRELLSQLDTFIGSLDRQRAQIVRALQGIDRLSATLSAQQATIQQALDTMPPALKVLADQRSSLTRMLRSLSDLGTVGTRVIRASKDDTLADLRQLQPVLARLNQAGSDLPNALELLTTYPFPRDVTDAVKGDYVNLHITADLDLKDLYGNLTAPSRGPTPPAKPTPGLPLPTALPTLPGLPKLPTPTRLPSLPGTTALPVPTATGSGGVLCPPVCTGTLADYRDPTAGIDRQLAQLMTEGIQP